MITYLTVLHLDDKNKVKDKGAQWDAERGLWFVPEGVSLRPFARWIIEDNAPPVYMYLTVPPKDMGKAIRLGAKYEQNHKSNSWYIPSGTPIAPFECWYPAFSIKASRQMRLEAAQQKNQSNRDKEAERQAMDAERRAIEALTKIIYLTVPGKDRIKARELGAICVPNNEANWYVPAGTPIAPFEQWSPAFNMKVSRQMGQKAATKAAITKQATTKADRLAAAAARQEARKATKPPA